MSSKISLPQELIEVIVDEIADRDILVLKRILRTCSFLSSSFRDPSQRKLFHAIHVAFGIHDSSVRQTARLLDILLTNPRIVSYIRTLWLRIGTPFYSAPGLSSALCRLPHVQKIIMETNHGLIPWETLHEDFRTDLLHLILSPTVRILLIGEVDFPIEYLRSLTHIKRIYLMPFFGARSGSIPLPIMPLVTPRETHLDSLSMTTQYYIWDKLLAALGTSISRLRRFKTFITYERDIAQIQDVIDASAGVLHWFGYYWHAETVRSPQRHLDLMNQSNLQHLFIGLYNVLNMEDALVWTCLVLGTIPENNRIVSIVIKSNVEPDLQCAAWSKIDELLTKKHFATLSHVVIDMEQKTGQLSLSSLQFPRLSAMGYFFDRTPLIERADWQW